MTDHVLAEIKKMNQEFIALTGREAYGYVSKPTPATTRVAFGDGHVAASMFEAHDHMTFLLRVAKDNPKQLPYPFDQDLTAQQDLRKQS